MSLVMPGKLNGLPPLVPHLSIDKDDSGTKKTLEQESLVMRVHDSTMPCSVFKRFLAPL